MARNSAGKGKLLEQPLQAGFVLADVGIDFAVRAFEIRIADQRRSTVTRARDVDNIEVPFLDDPI